MPQRRGVVTSDNPVNILLVDDEPANLLALEAVLDDVGTGFVRATSGEEALERVREREFALILLDVRMPSMDGFETARRIRAVPHAKATPIIFVTAADADEHRLEEAYALGAVDFLAKPLVPAVLKAKVGFFVEFHLSRQQLMAERVRASEERLRLATDVAKLGVFVWEPESDRVTWENEQPYAIFGIERSAEPITAARFLAEYLHPDDAPAFREALETALHGGGRFRFEGRFRRRSDGELRWIEFNGLVRPAADGAPLSILGTGADITDRKRVEAREREAATEARAAAEANAKFRAFFEQGSYFAGVMMPDGTLLEANRLSLDACGYTRDEVIGRKFWDCGWWNRSPALMDLVRKGCAQAAQGRVFQCETPYFVADGRQRLVDLILAPVTDDAGRVLYIAPTGADITERKRAEEELRRLAAELSESDRQKNEFLATLAHELRNPLAPLQNGLHIMRRADADAAAVTRARVMMERQLGHMVRLVNDLLDIARVSSGKVDLRKQRVTLQAVIESALESSADSMEAGGHHLAVELPEEPLVLDADPTRLAQALGNLLNNAAKYTPPGGRIVLAARREAAQVVVSVTDSGIGIPAESLPTVFDIFTQVGRNMHRAQGGLGVGLSLVRRLVDLHGGSVTGISAGAGQGSTFIVRLPLADAAGPNHEARPEGAPQLLENAAMNLRVLVVDDNVDAAESLAMLLELAGHTTRIAHDGRQALQAAEEFRPEVVFLDIGLPHMNGYEVAQAMRRMPDLQGATLVALTGWGAEADRARAKEAGFDHHLTKPTEPTAVEELLAALGR
jgi:PAS domain S-box-containing protein